jgi:integrase
MAKTNSKTKLTDAIVAELTCDATDTLCKGLHVRVRASGNKSWWLWLYTPDRTKRYKWKIGEVATFKLYEKTPSRNVDRSIRDRAEAIRAQSLTVDLRRAKRDSIAERDADVTAKLGSFIKLVYLDHYRAEGYARPDETLKWVCGAFESLMDKRIDAINHLDIQRWMREAGKNRKPATVARLLQSLAGILSHAISMGMIEKHPLQAKERKRPETRIKTIKIENKRIRYLSKDEEQRLRDALDNRDRSMKQARARTIRHRQERNLKSPVAITGAYADHLTPLTLLALNTGIRRGGLLGLKWDDVQNGQIFVSASLDKARRGYIVPLSSEAQDVLRKWNHQTGGKGKIFNIKSIKTAWGNLMREAGIEKFRFHDLRHSYASKLVMGGVDIYAVKELLGHQNIEMTERYSHFSPDHMAAALEVLNK